MQVGDLVYHKHLKESRQLGMIIKTWLVTCGEKYKVYWFAEQVEEYWYSQDDVGVLKEKL